MKHPAKRLEQWREYYKRNQSRIRASVEDRRKYFRTANKQILKEIGASKGCSECSGRFSATNEVKWYYNSNCPHFGAMLSSKLQDKRYLESLTHKLGRFFCSQCFNEFINTSKNTRHRAYRLSD